MPCESAPASGTTRRNFTKYFCWIHIWIYEGMLCVQSVTSFAFGWVANFKCVPTLSFGMGRGARGRSRQRHDTVCARVRCGGPGCRPTETNRVQLFRKLKARMWSQHSEQDSKIIVRSAYMGFGYWVWYGDACVVCEMGPKTWCGAPSLGMAGSAKDSALFWVTVSSGPPPPQICEGLKTGW